MADDFYSGIYNPDVLSCIANLSNDEVFTPPEAANAMLDLLPQELFASTETTFLDPACKSGVFLREIAKRLLDAHFPNYKEALDAINAKKSAGTALTAAEENYLTEFQAGVDHIFHHQLFGIAITELTSLLSRRGVYCSKFPNGEYSVSHFDDAEGNIRFKRIQHRWKDGKCVFCGASQSQYDRDASLETHAYEWIHTTKPEEIWKMKFDVIISNPPYQLSDGGNGASAKPIYQMFVQQAKKMRPKYMLMITPSRWFAGGKGLDAFRKEMLQDRHLTRIVDYQNAKDCFPGVSVGGGICYFKWDRDTISDCTITNIINDRTVTALRKLDEFPVFVRYNDAIDIINKVKRKQENSIVSTISSRNPFGFPTNYRGEPEPTKNTYKIFSSQGLGYVNKTEVAQGSEFISKYKIMISRVTSEHAGEPDKSGMYKVISKMQILEPGELCTDSYIVIYPSDSLSQVTNCFNYLQTKFARFLIMQTLSSINLSRDKYEFVPTQDFSKPWTDKELYEKYGLTEDEITFIESTIKPMDAGGDLNA
jgi:hypothetical protein